MEPNYQLVQTRKTSSHQGQVEQPDLASAEQVKLGKAE